MVGPSRRMVVNSCGSLDVMEGVWPQVCASGWEILVVMLGICLPLGACWTGGALGWAQRGLWVLHMCGVSLEGAGSSRGPTKPIMHLCVQPSQALEAMQLAVVTGT